MLNEDRNHYFFFFQKFLEASEFLQNVVYINLQLTDEEKVGEMHECPRIFILETHCYQHLMGDAILYLSVMSQL